MKCECGVVISKEQDEENTTIAAATNTPKLNLCLDCWFSYCYHAETGN